jgi:hypothetical protein
MSALTLEMQELAYSVCPERRDLFDAHYVTAFERVARCLGPALHQSRVPGSIHREQPLAHAQVALTVASQTVFILTADSSYRAWQQGQSTQITAAWARTAWRYALTMPIGYVVASHSVRVNASTTWNPALQDFVDFAPGPAFDVLDSSRTLSAPSIALAIFHRLFPADLPPEPMLNFALADAFSVTPNPDNPIAGSFRRALQKVIAPHRHMAYPYWWVLLHNQALAHRDDFRPLQINPPRVVPAPAEAESAPLPPSSVPAAPPPDDRAPPTPASPPSPTPLVAPTQTPAPDPLAVGALKIAAGCIAQKIFTLNCKGAVFHTFESGLHLVVPGGWDRLAAHMQRPDIDGERLAERMRASGFVVPDPVSGAEVIRIAFQPPEATAPVGSAFLSRLSPAAAELLFPTGAPTEDNVAVCRVS